MMIEAKVKVAMNRSALVVFALPFCASLVYGQAPCALKSTSPSVTICTPVDGAATTSPVNVIAGSTDTAHPVTLMQIYVDGVKKDEVSGNTINASVPMATGSRRLTVQARDSSGLYFRTTANITVASSAAGSINSINHIVLLVQENRSFDNYFGRFGQYRRNKGYAANVSELPLTVKLKDRAGNLISPFHFRTVCHSGLSPAWNESHYDLDGGKMDRFMLTTGSVYSSLDPNGHRAMGYYDWRDLPFYYELAFRFAMSDTFFSSLLSNTPPNRTYLFAASSFGYIRGGTPPTGGWPQPNIFDRLNAAGVSWKYYYHSGDKPLIQDWSTFNTSASNVVPITEYYTDLQNGTLPEFAFIERGYHLGLDEHPSNNIQRGAADAAKEINALMNSSAWASSVFFLTFDEGGGLYDHVVPITVPAPDNFPPKLLSTDLPGNFTQAGFRVPLVVISPWIKPKYISHVPRDFGSILKFIETRYALAPLSARDAKADDMTEMFSFASPQMLTPPALPAQPTTGVCDYALQTAP